MTKQKGVVNIALLIIVVAVVGALVYVIAVPKNPKRPAYSVDKTGKVCLQHPTTGKNPKTGEIQEFPDSCLPDGWIVVPPGTGIEAKINMGTISGHAEVGPICPVERYPHDPSCDPSPAAYMARSIMVYKAGSKNLVAKTSLDAHGNYVFELPPGQYDIYTFPDGTFSQPLFKKSITLSPNQTLRLDISIDTGIR